MMRYFRPFLCGLLIACSGSLAVQSAELRTSVGNREIHRAVSYQPIVEDYEPVLDYEQHPLSESEMLVDSCYTCGVTGCALDCLIPRYRWANFEYLLWWRRGQDFPSLVTTSPAGTAQGDAGVLPGAQVLFGNETEGEGVRPGGRITLGGWLDDCQTHGIEGRFFSLGEERIRFDADSAAFPILARPFRDPITATQEATLLAFPGFTGPGNVNITSDSNVLGGDFLYRRQVGQSSMTRVDFLVGYQFSRIDENFNINSFTSAINVPGIDAGTTFATDETFNARNQYQAGLIGLSATYFHCNWEIDLLAKVGFGNMNQVVIIDGQTTIVTPGPMPTTNVLPGPLAGTANRGRHENDEFAVSPELGVTGRYALSECLDLSVGYSFLYWSHVVQAGKHIDKSLNDPPAAFSFNSGSYWVHGLHVGAQWRF